jgi:Flp pilus assembly pilin Flp
MTKFAPLFALFAGALANTTLLNAQVFTGDLTQWSTLGAPSVPDSSTATIDSTSGDGAGGVYTVSAPASTLESALDNAPLQNNFGNVATDGQAVYLNFNLTSAVTVTFDWQMQTYDGAPYDSVGYVLNGGYYQLDEPPNYTGPYTSSVTSATVVLPANSSNFGFVAFNTGDNNTSTNLEVTNFTVVSLPEPNTVTLVLVTGVMLFLVRNRRSLGVLSSTLRRGLLASRRGQTLVEYALILAFISVVAIGVLITTGSSVKGVFTTVSNQLSVSANGGPFATPPGH